MRIQCPACSETVEVTRFTTAQAPARVTFGCPACDERVTLESEPADDDGDPPPPGDADSEPSERAGDDVLWRAWDAVAERFDSEGRHDAFLAACEGAGDLPFAAARYREWAESHPEDEIAAKRLQQISALAQVKAFLTVSKSKRDEDPLKKVLVLGLLLLAFIIIAVILAPMLFKSAKESKPDDSAPKTMAPNSPPLQNLRRAPPPGMPSGAVPLRAMAPRPTPR